MFSLNCCLFIVLFFLLFWELRVGVMEKGGEGIVWWLVK